MKRIILAALLGVSTVTVASTASAGQDKVSVCHHGDDGIELISIADPALDAHIAHGDAQPGAPAPGGGTYAEDCRVLPPADADGDGVTDGSDQCPLDPGPASNNGCPPPYTFVDACNATTELANVSSAAHSDGECFVSVFTETFLDLDQVVQILATGCSGTVIYEALYRGSGVLDFICNADLLPPTDPTFEEACLAISSRLLWPAVGAQYDLGEHAEGCLVFVRWETQEAIAVVTNFLTPSCSGLLEEVGDRGINTLDYVCHPERS